MESYGVMDSVLTHDFGINFIDFILSWRSTSMTRALRLPHAHVHAKRNIEDEMLLSPKAKMRDIIEPLLALVVQVRLDKIERQERIETLFNN